MILLACCREKPNRSAISGMTTRSVSRRGTDDGPRAPNGVVLEPAKLGLNSKKPRRARPFAGFRDHGTFSFENIPAWRWRESNPRPSASQQDFSERSR
jgi:hypothetical protein